MRTTDSDEEDDEEEPRQSRSSRERRTSREFAPAAPHDKRHKTAPVEGAPRRAVHGATVEEVERARAMGAPLVGARVCVRGLQGRPELEGVAAMATSFSFASGRYVVVVLGSKEELHVRPTNLAPL